MSRPRWEEFWVETVRFLTQEAADNGNPKLGPGPIKGLLKEIAEQEGRDRVPSERWIGAEQAKFRLLSEADRREYSILRWPDAFEHRALDWDHMRASLELLDWCETHAKPVPTVGAARWFARFRYSFPEIKTDDLYNAAWAMSVRQWQTSGTDMAELVGRWLMDFIHSPDNPKPFTWRGLDALARFKLNPEAWKKGWSKIDAESP